MTKKPLSREAIRAIAIRNRIKRQEQETQAKAAQGVLPGIVDETPTDPKPMHPRLLAMCVDAAGIGQDSYADAA
jgi:hypothetical protein